MSAGTLPLAGIPDERLEEVSLGRPVASVYDIVALYGRLNSLLTVERVEGDVSPEYVPYMTPDNDKIQDLYDQEDSLLNVHVDLSGDDPSLAEKELVSVERLTWQKAILTGYTRPINKRGPIIAHSIPHHANRKDAETTAGYATDRLTRWPTDDQVKSVAAEPDVETVIDQLRALGEREEIQERISDAVEARVDDLGGTFEGLVSLRIRTEADGEFRYPGEIDIVNQAMAAKKAERMKGYSSASDSSGEAADYVTGSVGEAFGATPGSPIEYFHGKQTEKFPNLNPDAGYQVRPLSEATAADIAAGQAYTEACSVYFGGGVEIRYLPYVEGSTTADDLRQLTELLDTALNSDQSFRNLLIDRLTERSRFAQSLRLYQIVVATELDRKNKLLSETADITALRPVEIADRHIALLDIWPHSESGWLKVFRGGSSPDDQFSLLDRENTRLAQSILGGQYFNNTLHNPQQETDPDNRVFGPDNVRLLATTALVAGDTLPTHRMQRSAVRRIIKRQNELLGDSETERDFPHYVVAAQHVQFSALASLDAFDDEPPFPVFDPEIEMTDEPMSRDAKLEQFINNHPQLDDPARRTCFLLGAFVGRLSASQMREGVSTMISRYPVENVTRRNVSRIVYKVIEKNNSYSDREGIGLMNMRYQRRLTDLLHQSDPTDWELSTDAIRMHYALGIAYGYSDTSPETEDEAPEDQLDAAASTSQ